MFQQQPVGIVEVIGGPSSAQRSDAQFGVLQDLGVPHGGLPAGLAANGEPEPADRVLPAIEQGLAGR